MKVWVVTTNKKNKVVGVFSKAELAKKAIQHPENVTTTVYTVNVGPIED